MCLQRSLQGLILVIAGSLDPCVRFENGAWGVTRARLSGWTGAPSLLNLR